MLKGTLRVKEPGMWGLEVSVLDYDSKRALVRIKGEKHEFDVRRSEVEIHFPPKDSWWDFMFR